MTFATKNASPPALARLAALAALVALVALVASCSTPRTELVVTVDTDIDWGPNATMRSVSLTVKSDGPDGTIRDERNVTLGLDTSMQFELPASFGVVPLGGDSQRVVWVEARGCRTAGGCEAADAITLQRAMVGFVPGQTLGLRMVLAASCASVQCNDGTQTCDATTGMCVTAAVDRNSLPTYMPSAGSGAVQVSNLRADWSTPNCVRWQWDPTGNSEALARYELVVGTSMQDVTTRSGSAIVQTPTESPELGHFILPRDLGVDVVNSTLSFALAPDTQYYAQLTATDTAGQTSVSNVATVRTSLAPIGQVVIFSDALQMGYTQPAELMPVSDMPFAGSGDLLYDSATCMPDCYENLRLSEQSVSLADVSEGTFQSTAYVEFALEAELSTPSFWSEVRVEYTCAAGSCFTHFYPFTVPATGGYRVYQVPLRRMWDETGRPVTYALASGGIQEFNVGGSWALGGHVRLDEISVRW